MIFFVVIVLVDVNGVDLKKKCVLFRDYVDLKVLYGGFY